MAAPFKRISYANKKKKYKFITRKNITVRKYSLLEQYSNIYPSLKYYSKRPAKLTYDILNKKHRDYPRYNDLYDYLEKHNLHFVVPVLKRNQTDLDKSRLDKRKFKHYFNKIRYKLEPKNYKYISGFTPEMLEAWKKVEQEKFDKKKMEEEIKEKQIEEEKKKQERIKKRKKKKK